MTIDDVMALVDTHAKAVHDGADEVCISTRADLRAAILTLISEREDAEAEACAEIVMAEQATPHGAAYCEAAIRARIDARKGGNDGS